MHGTLIGTNNLNICTELISVNFFFLSKLQTEKFLYQNQNFFGQKLEF